MTKDTLKDLAATVILHLLLISGGLLAGFVLIEVALHILMPPQPDFHMRDPYVGKRFVPSLQIELHGSDKFQKIWTSQIHINSLGWNSPEFTAAKPEGVTRIVHLGDSIVEGAHVDTPDTFSAQLNGLLPKTESLNLGVAGNGTYPELLIERHYAKSYHPDAVFLWFSDNDFRDNYLVRQVVSTDASTPVQSDRLGWLKHLLLNKLLFPKLLYTLTYQNHLVVSGLIKMGLLSMEPQEFAEPIPLLYRTTVLDTPERAESLAITRKLMRALKDEVGKSQLVIGYVASYFETFPDTTEELRQQFPAIGNRTIEHDFPRNSMRQIARELDVPFFDLTDTFRTAYIRGKVPHIPGDGHLSLEGHTMVAENIAAWLKQRSLCCGRVINAPAP